MDRVNKSGEILNEVTYEKRRIINKRPVLFVAAFLLLGIAVSAAFSGSVGIALILFTGLVLLTGFTFFRKKRFPYMLSAFIIGFVVFAISASAFAINEGYFENAAVSARIKGAATSSGEYTYGYVAEDVTVNGNFVDGNAIIYTDKQLAIGDIVSAVADVQSEKPNPFDSFSMSRYKLKVVHRVYAVDSVSVTDKTELTVFERYRRRIKETFLVNMGDDAGGFGLALILGDKSALNSDISENLKTSGLSHIIAVSGLHIAFVAAALMFLLKKMGLKPTITAIVVLGVLLLYGALTGFPSSILRAIIMSGILSASKILFRKYGPLSALSAAVILITFFKPYSLFELGFQMSVAAVLGIILFFAPIRRVFGYGKNKVINFIASSLALSISANSVLFAIMINTFGVFGTYFCVSNLLAIPLVSITYTALMTATVISTVIPFAGVLLIPVKYMLLGINGLAGAIANLPGAALTLRPNLFLGVAFVGGLIFASRFIMLEKDKKYRFLTLYTGLSAFIAAVIVF